ncbi:MAG: hypothetical protein JNL81_06045 [Hyphomonadaceae bacterium]|nr:hypothetical protein [Hyphomonadaceae bacterium]
MLIRLFGGAALALGLLASPASAQTDDILAPARAGQLQCFEPNVANKTCQALDAYTVGADGAVQNATQAVISPAPLIVMRMVLNVTIRDNAICGPLTTADINAATFTVDGNPASAEQTAQIQNAMRNQLGPMLNLETCLTLRPDGDTMRAETALNGVGRPDMAQRMIWVGANDGYRVAP